MQKRSNPESFILNPQSLKLLPLHGKPPRILLRKPQQRLPLLLQRLLRALVELDERRQRQRRAFRLADEAPRAGYEAVDQEGGQDAQVLRGDARLVLRGDDARAVVVGQEEVVELGEETHRR